MKATPRTRKLGETVRDALADVILTELEDPRLELATVTSVEVSRDMRCADVYVITHGGDERYTALLEGLESARGRLKAGIAARVSMKYVPELRFHIDPSVDEGMRIYEALRADAGRIPPSGGEDAE